MAFVFPTGVTRAYDKRITGSQLANGYFSPHLFPKRLIKKFDANLVMESCVNKDYESEIKGPGDVIHVREIGDVSIVPYERYDTIEYQELDEGDNLLTITEQDMFAFEMDILDESDFDFDLLEQYTGRAAYNLADHVDQYLLGVGIDGASALNSIGTLTSPEAITQDNLYQILTEAYKNLRRSKAFKDRKKPFIVASPEFEMVIRNMPQFIPTALGGASTEGAVAFARASESIGRVANFDIKITENIESDSDGVQQLLFGTQEAITFAQKVAKVERLKQRESKFGQAVRGLFYYGAKVFYPNCLGTITCTLNLSTT